MESFTDSLDLEFLAASDEILEESLQGHLQDSNIWTGIDSWLESWEAFL